MKNILFLYILLLFGCNEKKATMLEAIDLRNSLNQKPMNVTLPDIFNSIIKVSLETSDSILIDKIENIIVENDLIYINNNNKCHIFNKSGKCLYKIDNKGEGPNEYLLISQLIVENKKILIYDGMKRKILRYDETGCFIKSINVPLNFMKIEKLENGNFIGYIPNVTGREKIKFGIFNEQGIFLDSILHNNQFDCKMFLSFEDEGKFFQNNNNLYFKEYLNDTIYQIKNGKLTPQSYFELGDKRSREMVRAESDQDLSGTYFPNMIRIDILGETKKYLFFFAKGLIYYDKENKIHEKFKTIFEDKGLRFLSVSNDNKYIITYRSKDNDENPEVILLKVKE